MSDQEPTKQQGAWYEGGGKAFLRSETERITRYVVAAVVVVAVLLIGGWVLTSISEDDADVKINGDKVEACTKLANDVDQRDCMERALD